MDSINLDHLQALCRAGNIIWSDHVIKRLFQRNISRDSVKSCIMSGEIIEEYPDDYPYPSCLVFGLSVDGKVLHVVVGEGAGKAWIITAYWPDPNKWDETLKIRKER